MPNDDLDLQLVWLHAVEAVWSKAAIKELGQEWAEHVFFPFDEYGYALAISKGFKAAGAGWFNNPLPTAWVLLYVLKFGPCFVRERRPLQPGMLIRMP